MIPMAIQGVPSIPVGRERDPIKYPNEKKNGSETRKVTILPNMRIFTGLD